MALLAIALPAQPAAAGGGEIGPGDAGNRGWEWVEILERQLASLHGLLP